MSKSNVAQIGNQNFNGVNARCYVENFDKEFFPTFRGQKFLNFRCRQIRDK